MERGSNLSDGEINTLLTNMKKGVEENDIFKGWPMAKKRLFYESTLVKLPVPTKKIDNRLSKVQDSVVFDLTNPDKILASYHRAIQHYQNWQLSGSDESFEFDKVNKSWVTRADGTFVFWYRYMEFDVGLVIDGQEAWIEGMLRRQSNPDGTFTYKEPLQFTKSESSSDSQNQGVVKKVKAERTYIMAENVQILKSGGNYTGSVSNIIMSIQQLQSAVIGISCYDLKESFKKACGTLCDILILFSTEAAKNHMVLQFTTQSLSKEEGLYEEFQLPSTLNTTVTKHKKVSEESLNAIEQMLQQKTPDNEAEFYDIVRGAPYRTLSQCVEAYPIFRRKTCFKTKFFLRNMESSYHSGNKPMQPRRFQTSAEAEEYKREERLSRGSLYYERYHGGIRDKDSDEEKDEEKYLLKLPKPYKQSKWYHYYPLPDEGDLLVSRII